MAMSEPQLQHPMTRRGFLVRSAGVSASLTLGACVPSQEASYRELLPSDAAPASLPVREYAVLRAVAERMIPADAANPSANDVGVVPMLDRELGFHGPRLRHDLRDALRLVEWGPLLTHLTRFTELPAEDQDQVLRDMMTSRFQVRRQAFLGLKFIIFFFYYTRPETWKAIGYEGPWVPPGPEQTWA